MNVHDFFLKCLPKDGQFPFLKIVENEGCRLVLLEAQGHALTTNGNRPTLLAPITYNKKR
jgi:hypothetical protein